MKRKEMLMKKIRVYNDEEIKKLLSNKNIDSVNNKCHIIYKNSFKLSAVKEKISSPEKTAREIFEKAGFDMKILDDRTPQRRLCSWLKKYKMFGEDYFNEKNKYSYKAEDKNDNPYLSKTLNDPNFLAFVISKKDNGTLEYRVIRKNNEKDNR